jgi:hypothetical protein
LLNLLGSLKIVKMAPHKLEITDIGIESEVGEKEERHWIMGMEKFKGTMAHHSGIKALWETKWKFPCTKAVYPFHDGKYEDFVPVFEHLIAVSDRRASLQ